MTTLIEFLVYPMAEEAEGSVGGDNCMRFLSQFFSHPSMNLVDMWRSQFGESVGRVYYILRTALPVLYLSNLVDTLAGLMAAPVSASTHAEILELRAGGQRLA